MATIFKYPLPMNCEPFELKIKGFCEVVHTGIDGNGQQCLWALVRPESMEESWTYKIVPTGGDFDMKDWSYVSTFMAGPFVWHLLRPTEDWGRQGYAGEVSDKDRQLHGSLPWAMATGRPFRQKSLANESYWITTDRETAVNAPKGVWIRLKYDFSAEQITATDWEVYTEANDLPRVVNMMTPNPRI